MKITTLAALVGSISLGALATGCAHSSAAAAPAATTEKGAQGSCGANHDQAAPAAAQPTPEKGTQGSCSAGSCSGNH